jgi:PAS domain S-box-containing protein
VAGFYCVATETTERVLAEQALHQSYRTLFEAMDEGYLLADVIFDDEGRAADIQYVEANPAATRMIGQDLTGRRLSEASPDYEDYWYEIWGRVARTGKGERLERYAAPEGLWYDFYVFKPEPDNAASNRVAVLFQDVSQRKQAEMALRDSEARHRALAESAQRQAAELSAVLESMPDAVYIGTSEGITLANQRALDQLGFESREELNRNIAVLAAEIDTRDYHTGAFIPPEQQVYARALRGESAVQDVRVRHRGTGEERVVRSAAAPVKIDGAVIAAVAVNTDVTGHRRAQAGLRELNETLERRVQEALAERTLWADFFRNSGALIGALDLDRRFIAVNKAYADAFEAFFGLRPKVGDDIEALLAGQPTKSAAILEFWARALAGEEFTVVNDNKGRAPFFEFHFNPLRDQSGRITGALQYAVDVSQRVQAQARLAEAQEALRQSQKLEAMGQLTGGVAHDFNNLLTPIVGGLDMLQRRGVGDERAQRQIIWALQAAERARALVQRLLAFARRQPLQPTAVDVGALVEGIADLVSSTSGPRIRLELDVASALPAARADVNQIEMAILNLAVNARDAMPDGGTLTISAQRDDVGQGHRSKLPAGIYVKLAVSDTGVGMTEEILSRAIEPFFSTKGVGQGTGLGLSMVHGLALQLGGALTLQSRHGLGTTVELWLPLAGHAPREAEREPPDQAVAPMGLVLLVDDEPLARDSTADMITDLGYEVLEATSAEEALRRLEEGIEPRLLITDHLMPGMTGVELVVAARQFFPHLPVLIISGYAEDNGIPSDLPRLTKPFRQAELLDSLSKLLRQ